MDRKRVNLFEAAILAGAVGTAVFGAATLHARESSTSYCCGRSGCWELNSSLIACDPAENECNSPYSACCEVAETDLCS